jgi:hypothetical protein
MSKSLGLMILLAPLKFCWRILNFAGVVFEAKVVPAKDLHQQNSAGVCQKIPSLRAPAEFFWQLLPQKLRQQNLGPCSQQHFGMIHGMIVGMMI